MVYIDQIAIGIVFIALIHLNPCAGGLNSYGIKKTGFRYNSGGTISPYPLFL